MKILFLKKSPFILDYMSDSIYHGLVKSGHDVYILDGFDYMYKWFTGDITDKKFTLYKTLDGQPNTLFYDKLLDLIASKFFDKIIISDIRYYNGFYNDCKIIFQGYKKSDIHLIDGTDDYFVLSGISNYGTLWKRELRSSSNDINPISFAIPEEKIISKITDKEKLFAHVIPGDIGTYIFGDEKTYYDDYRKSYYGMTWRKCGWDCLRHYEILLNGCIPYFKDIDSCPDNTMVNFPKEIIKETNKYAEKSDIHPRYNEIVSELLEYTKLNLTTKALAEKIINY